MSTKSEIKAAVESVGYLYFDRHVCLNCGGERDAAAILAGIQGCMVECRACIEKRAGKTVEEQIAAKRSPRTYPTTGRISSDDPSLYGSELLGWEGITWQSFNQRHQPVDSGCTNPYRRGIGQGFGSTEDGEAE